MIDWSKPIEVLFAEDAEWVSSTFALEVKTPKDKNSPLKYLLFIPNEHVYIYDGNTEKCLGVLCDGCVIMNDEGMGILIRNSIEDEVRNKPGFDLKGLDEHLNTRQESETIYDPIEHPSHYNEGRKYETIDVIEDWNLGYHLSNALKYLSRYNRKGDGIQDLKKAVWYIQCKIKLEEK